MPVPMTPYLRNVLALDAATCAGAALLMIAGGGILSPLLSIPAGLLFWAGIALVPFTALLVWALRRETLPRFVLVDIVAINALWVAASFGILVAGLVSPNAFGVGFVSVQALAVAGIAAMQFAALRRSASAAA